jgi:hypothetical protein
MAMPLEHPGFAETGQHPRGLRPCGPPVEDIERHTGGVAGSHGRGGIVCNHERPVFGERIVLPRGRTGWAHVFPVAPRKVPRPGLRERRIAPGQAARNERSDTALVHLNTDERSIVGRGDRAKEEGRGGITGGVDNQIAFGNRRGLRCMDARGALPVQILVDDHYVGAGRDMEQTAL